MASGKYKPALFELLKTSKKPEGGDTLETPKWFYTGKKVRTEPLRQESVVTKTNAAVAPADKTVASKAEIPPGGVEARQRYRFSPSASMPEGLSSRKLTITVSYWLLGLALLTQLVVVIGAYRLGQNNPPLFAAVDGPTDAGPTSSGPVTDLGSAPGAEQSLVQSSELAAQASGSTEDFEPQATPADTTIAPPGPSAKEIALIICSDSQLRNLKPVQQYFNTSGLDTSIGRYGKQYVLYSSQVFPSVEATRSLRAQVKALGMHYNDKKPRSAPIFQPDTFASAYTVNTDRITKDF